MKSPFYWLSLGLAVMAALMHDWVAGKIWVAASVIIAAIVDERGRK
ncbi:hypothetical protein [Sphingobium yanoikuyae]